MSSSKQQDRSRTSSELHHLGEWASVMQSGSLTRNSNCRFVELTKLFSEFTPELLPCLPKPAIEVLVWEIKVALSPHLDPVSHQANGYLPGGSQIPQQDKGKPIARLKE